jgi:hypothetical protein
MRRWSVSDCVSDAVGSSMKTIFASPTRARAIATICRWAIANSLSGRSTSSETPSRASALTASFSHAVVVDETRPASEQRMKSNVFGDAHLRKESEILPDHLNAGCCAVTGDICE